MVSSDNLSRRAHAARRFGVSLAIAGCTLVGFGESVHAQIDWRSAPTEALLPLPAPDVAASIEDMLGDRVQRHVVVQFAQPVAETVKQELRAAGVHLQAYLDNYAYVALVQADQFDAGAVGALATLIGAVELRPQVKQHPDFLAGDLPSWSVVGETNAAGEQPPEPIVAAYVMFHRDVPIERGEVLAMANGARVMSTLESINSLVIELPFSSVARLVELDEVLWIEPPLPPFDVNNDSNREAVQADLAQGAPYNLDGTGVTVLVYDAGTGNAGHPDFGGRLSVHDSSGTGNHATHTAGTVGGDGSASGGQYAGMAPNVTIVAYGFEQPGGLSAGFLYTDPGDLEDDYDEAINIHGADISNNSIGSNVESNGFNCDWQGDYGVTAALIDDIVRGSLGDPIRIVWSAGNERGGSGCDIEGFGDYYSTAPPACAKNHLTIGALNSNDNSMTSFSSWGPTDDGRMKPDVCGPGCQDNDDGGVTSTSSSGGYTTLCGTSMSGPTIAGCAALLLQDYRAQFPGLTDFLPSTMKSIFAHTALDLGNPGPDYQFGYGNVQVKDAIDFMRSGSWVEGVITQGETQSYLVEVAPGDNQLKATIAWADPSGTPLVNPNLVNDINIRVNGPGGDSFPWLLDPSNPDDNATTGVDGRNNIEQVLISNPQAGTYTVIVEGADIAQGPQSYSLSVTPTTELLTSTSISLPGGAVTQVLPGTPTTFTVQIGAVGEELVPNSEMLHTRINGGSFVDTLLTPLGDDLYEATLPAVNCDDTLEYYLSAEGSESGVVTNPFGAPGDLYSVIVGEDLLAFDDDLESDMGWSVGSGDDDATTGIWERVDPNGTAAQPEDDHTPDPGTLCWVTGQGSPGGSVGENDVDGGQTTLLTPILDATVDNATISYWRWYSNTEGASPNADVFVIDISNNGGASWTNVETIGPEGSGTSGGWFFHEFAVADIIPPTNQVQLRFIASDEDAGSIVEAAIDDFQINGFTCEDTGVVGDLNGDGTVDAADLAILLGAWGPCPGCPADLNGDGVVDAADLAILLGNWG